MRYRVTVRSYNFLTAEIEAPENAPEEVLRNRLFDLAEDGEIDWETDYTETSVTPLTVTPPDTPAPPDPSAVDYDGGPETP